MTFDPVTIAEFLDTAEGSPPWHEPRVTRRDYFTACALVGILQNDWSRSMTEVEIAEMSVREADAVLIVLARKDLGTRGGST